MKTKRVLFFLIVIGVVVASGLACAETKPIIVDDIDLLTDDEEVKLTEYMKPICDFGVPVFWSTDEPGDHELAYSYFRSHFAGKQSGVIFVINMNSRLLTIYSNAYMSTVITGDKANEITGNVFRMATNGEYYECACSTFNQIVALLEKANPEEKKFKGFRGLQWGASLDDIIAAEGKQPDKKSSIVDINQQVNEHLISWLGTADSYVLLLYEEVNFSKFENAHLMYVLKDDKLCMAVYNISDSDNDNGNLKEDYDYLLEALSSLYGENDEILGWNIVQHLISYPGYENQASLPETYKKRYPAAGWSVEGARIALHMSGGTELLVCYVDDGVLPSDSDSNNTELNTNGL